MSDRHEQRIYETAKGPMTWSERVADAAGAGVALTHVACPHCGEVEAEHCDTVDGWGITCEACGYVDAPW